MGIKKGFLALLLLAASMQAQAFHFSEKPFKKNESRRIVVSTRDELSIGLADVLHKEGWNPGEADVATILTLPIFDEHDAFNIGVEPEYGGKRVCLTIVNKKVFAKFSPVPITQTENERLTELVLRHEDSHCLSKRDDGDEMAGILSESRSDSEAIQTDSDYHLLSMVRTVRMLTDGFASHWTVPYLKTERIEGKKAADRLIRGLRLGDAERIENAWSMFRTALLKTKDGSTEREVMWNEATLVLPKTLRPFAPSIDDLRNLSIRIFGDETKWEKRLLGLAAKTVKQQETQPNE